MVSEGLWLIQFHIPSTGETRPGVVVFQGNKLMGGDSTYYYSGSYSTADQDILIGLRIIKHSPGISIFGRLTDFRLSLQGKQDNVGMLLEGCLDHRDVSLQVKLSKLH